MVSAETQTAIDRFLTERQPGPHRGVVPLLLSGVIFLLALWFVGSGTFVVVERDDDSTSRHSHDLPQGTQTLGIGLGLAGLGVVAAGLAAARLRTPAALLAVALVAAVAIVSIHAWTTLDATGRSAKPAGYQCEECVVDARPDGGLVLATFSSAAGVAVLAFLLVVEHQPRSQP